MSTTPQNYYPDVSNETGPKTQFAFRIIQQALQQHDQAITTLKGQLTDAVAAQTTINETVNNNTSGSSTPSTPTPSLGGVNNQTGIAYSTQTSDYGGIITFNNASAVAVTLNASVAQYWFSTLENVGVGLVTITPGSGTINGAATLALATNLGCAIFFDGSNWWAFTVPVATTTYPGLVQPDGTTITITAGVISATGGGGGGVTRGALMSNADGSYWTWSDGVIEQFGSVTVLATSTSGATATLTFPTAFVSSVYSLDLCVNGLPRATFAGIANTQIAALTLTGGTIYVQTSVPEGGGGATLDQNVSVFWRAIGK